MGLLPLHAVPSGIASGRHLIDVANISYFPSVQLLDQSERRSSVRNLSRLLLFKGRDVPFSNDLHRAAVAMFGEAVVKGTTLSPGVVKREMETAPNGTMSVFSCHALAMEQDVFSSGIFFGTPGESRLPELALPELLDINSIASRLVLLNGCETALSGIADPADECLSIANTFLAGGSRRVIGTQWRANAYSSALWCFSFLERIRAGNIDALAASSLTSRWLRDSSGDDRRNLLYRWKCSPGDVEVLERQDFSHPFHWANHKFHGAP